MAQQKNCKVNNAQFNLRTGISPPEISRLRSGKKKVTFQNAALIEFGTDGAIKMETMLEDQHLRTVAGFIRANVSQ